MMEFSSGSPKSLMMLVDDEQKESSKGGRSEKFYTPTLPPHRTPLLLVDSRFLATGATVPQAGFPRASVSPRND